MAAVLHASTTSYAGDKCAVVGSMMASLALLVVGTALWAAKLPAGATLFLFGVAMFTLSLTALAIVYKRGILDDGEDPNKTDAPPPYRMSWRKSFLRRMRSESRRTADDEMDTPGFENHTIVELSPDGEDPNHHASSESVSITSSEVPAPTRDVWFLRSEGLGGSLPCVMGRRSSADERPRRPNVRSGSLWGSARGVGKSVRDVDFLPSYEMAMKALEENSIQRPSE